MSEKEINNLIQTGEAAKAESPVSSKEAEEYAEAKLEDLKAENNNRKKRLIKLGTRASEKKSVKNQSTVIK